MNSKEIKTAVSNLEKAQEDKTILEILKSLDEGVKASESLLRETKVGVAVNKFRSSKNAEIVNLVKKMIKNWKDEVKKSKHKKLPSIDEKSKPVNGDKSASSSASAPPASKPEKIYDGVRTWKTDSVDYAIYDNKTRNGSLLALYNGLAKDNKTKSSNEIFEIVTEIETAVFNLSKFETNNDYRSKLRSLVMNLKSANNPELREKVLSKEIAPHRLVKMSPEEMVNEKFRQEKEKIEKENLFKAKSAVEKRAVTDSFICGKCKQRKVTYYQMQTRSADEPLTTFCTCVNCGNHWTFS